METAPRVSGKRVAELRQARGWTQYELSKKAGLSKRTIERLESEQFAPRLDTIRRLAEVFAVELVSLFSTQLAGEAPVAAGVKAPIAERRCPATGEPLEMGIDCPLELWGDMQIEALREALKNLLATREEVLCRFSRKGSTLARMRIPDGTALTVVKAVEAGAFKELGVTTWASVPEVPEFDCWTTEFLQDWLAQHSTAFHEESNAIRPDILDVALAAYVLKERDPLLVERIENEELGRPAYFSKLTRFLILAPWPKLQAFRAKDISLDEALAVVAQSDDHGDSDSVIRGMLTAARADSD